MSGSFNMGAQFSSDPSCHQQVAPETRQLLDRYQAAYAGDTQLDESNRSTIKQFISIVARQLVSSDTDRAIELIPLQTFRSTAGSLHILVDIREKGSQRSLCASKESGLIGITAGHRCITAFELPLNPGIASEDTMLDAIISAATVRTIVPRETLKAELERFEQGDLSGLFGSYARQIPPQFRGILLHPETTRVCFGEFNGTTTAAIRFNDTGGGHLVYALGISKKDGALTPQYGMCFPGAGCAMRDAAPHSFEQDASASGFAEFFDPLKFESIAATDDLLPRHILNAAAREVIKASMGDPGDSWTVTVLDGVRSRIEPDRCILKIRVTKESGESLLPCCDGETLTRSELPTASLVEVIMQGDALKDFHYIGFCLPAPILGADLNTLCTKPEKSVLGNAVYDAMIDDLRSNGCLGPEQELPTANISFRALQLGISGRQESFMVLAETAFGDQLIHISRDTESGIVRVSGKEGLSASKIAHDISVMAFFRAPIPSNELEGEASSPDQSPPLDP
ncbi:MAG: hypothetical protein QY326_08445 [Bdellovibrionota bacterium]|nr:MAG: hypothetical protein QY326_08445 [Bdellovibrionota bacterium]